MLLCQGVTGMNKALIAALIIPLLFVLTTNAVHAENITIVCPNVGRASHVPYNYTLGPLAPPNANITAAIMLTSDKLLVAYSDGSVSLITAPSPDGSYRIVRNATIGVYIERFTPVSANLVAGIGYTLGAPAPSVNPVVVFFQACGPGCLNIWGTYAVERQPVLVWYSLNPNLPPSERVEMLYTAVLAGGAKTARVLTVATPEAPNLVAAVRDIPLTYQVYRAQYVSWCNQVHYGVVIEDYDPNAGNATPTLLLYPDPGGVTTLAAGYHMLAASYQPSLAQLTIYAEDVDATRLYLLIRTAASESATVYATSLPAPTRVVPIDTYTGRYALLYYAQPAPMLRYYNFTDPARPQLLWSIPLPGQATLIKPVEECNPSHLLVVVKDEEGNLLALLVDINTGRLLWDYLLGVRADAATALHYTHGWLVASDGSNIYLLRVDKLLTSLYLVKFGVYLGGVPAPFTLTLQCIAGSCTTVDLLRSGYRVEGYGVLSVAVPPGLYAYNVYSSKAGVHHGLFKLIGRGECRLLPYTDPDIVIRVPLYNVTVCVESSGDPQGWGLGKGPVPGAEVVLHAVFGYEASGATNKTGCATLRVPPGNYTLLVKARGFYPLNESIEIKRPRVIRVNLNPIPIYYRLAVYAWDTREPVRDATIIIRDERTGRYATVKPFEKIALPPGNYTLIASAPLYREIRRTITVEPVHAPVEKTLTLYLYPREFTIEFIVHLQMPLKKNATLLVTLARISPTRTAPVTIHEPIVAGSEIVKFKLKLYWGVYEAKLVAPLHQPAKVVFEVPKQTRVEANLSVVQYKLRIIAIDVVTRHVVKALVRAETVGYRIEFETGKYVSLPIGNYTVTIIAPFYQPVRKKIILDHDIDMRVMLNPQLVEVKVKALIGRNPLKNATVYVTGKSFNGIHVSKQLRLDDKGEAVTRLMPGNYTFSVYRLVHTLFLTFNLTAEKRVEITKSTTVTLEIRETVLLLLIHILPYLLIVLLILVGIVIFMVARRALRERIRKLREAIAERLGGRVSGELEEELEI